MSTNDFDLITCDRCQRHYNIEVYHRHREENQCIKRNQTRLPFQSIKQRSIQIGDHLFSVQPPEKKSGKKKPSIPVNTKSATRSHEPLQRFLPSNSRRRTLEQAKQLLERRTKYQPPWIQKRSNSTKTQPSKVSAAALQGKDCSYKMVDQSTQKSHSSDRSSPPRTKFPTDDLPIKSNNGKSISITSNPSRHHHHHQQPVLTNSPKTRVFQNISTSKPLQSQMHQVDQTFSREPLNSACRPIRKANTWTRSSKQSGNRDVISPIHIPTFDESSSDRIALPVNQNYDDDEFERYSPTPTPRCIEQQTTMKRPATYQKSKRSGRQGPQSEPEEQLSLMMYLAFFLVPVESRRKNTQSNFHLPPINPKSSSSSRPWR